MTSPAVSVIVPTHNRARLLGRAIRSVLVQTLRDFEVIVVDDGSTDGTKEVVHGFRDSRIRYIAHERNRGVCAARNTAIRAASGRYIAFLDSDDEYFPTKLEKQLRVLGEGQGQKTGAVACGWVWELSHDEMIRMSPPACTLDNVFALRSYVPITSLCIDRRYFDNGLSFDESLGSLEEWDLLVRLLQSGACVYPVDMPLYVVHYHEGPRLSDTGAKLQPRLRLLEKYSQELQSRPKARSMHHFRVAINYYQLGAKRGLRRHLYEAVKAYPWYFKRYLFLIAALLGLKPFGLYYWLYRRLGLVRARTAFQRAGGPQEYPGK